MSSFAPSSAWNQYAVLSCEEMRRAEKRAIDKGATGSELMQRAGYAAANIIAERYPPQRTVVLCGPGNNGGDGYICAEELRLKGWDVVVGATVPPDQMTGDAREAASAWQGVTTPIETIDLGRRGLIVDALFGTGLSRPIEGAAAAIIEKFTHTSRPIVALDLPSGVDGNNGHILGNAMKAALTIAFGRKKCGHLMLPAAGICGKVVVADIGIDDKTFAETHPLTAENDLDVWYGTFPFPHMEDHKYTRGQAFIYGGPVMTGATRMAARAAQRVGAGLVTLAAANTASGLYAGTLESVIVRTIENVGMWRNMINEQRHSAILIGPGLGLGKLERDLVLTALESGKPCVIDADALSNFAGDPDTLLSKLNADCVLTPHEGEFKRLFGSVVDESLDKLTRARQAADLAGCTVLLKGADTIIASPDGHAIINTNAPPWLATAGAGDVLAGMILGLITQQMPSFMAAAAAAWLHGQIAADFGPGLIAEDLVAGIPAALSSIMIIDDESDAPIPQQAVGFPANS